MSRIDALAVFAIFQSVTLQSFGDPFAQDLPQDEADEKLAYLPTTVIQTEVTTTRTKDKTSWDYTSKTTEKTPLPNTISQTCTSTENVCPSCDFMAVCVDQGDGTFNTLVQKCRPGEKCVKGKCVMGAHCHFGEFSCSQEGYFPDPYDCTLYHVCLPLGYNDFKKETYSCNSTSYDAGRRSCGHSLVSEACKKGPVPECLIRTQLGVIPGTGGSLYYFCEERKELLTPLLHMCPQSFEFNVGKKKCEDNRICKDCKIAYFDQSIPLKEEPSLQKDYLERGEPRPYPAMVFKRVVFKNGKNN